MPPARLDTYRRRISKMVRRVERDPSRATVLLREEFPRLLAELKRLGPAEPALVLGALLHLLGHLPGLATEMEDEGHSFDGLAAIMLARVSALLRKDLASGAEEVDCDSALSRLFQLWNSDASGVLHEAEGIILDAVDAGASSKGLTAILRELLDGLPLVFPATPGAPADLRRTLLLAERHRLERLYGELLARSGYLEYSIVVARDHDRATGDAIDLVLALRRAGHLAEALGVARKAVASPRSFQKRRLRELIEEMLSEPGEISNDRETRKTLEEEFLCLPQVATFLALKAATQPDQWPRLRGRVFGHLEKHQKSPSILFRLFLDEKMIQRADSLVRNHPVDPDALVEGARRIAAEEAEKASGWLILAAFARAGEAKPRLYPRTVRDLEEALQIAKRFDQGEAFKLAIAKFRRRFHRRRALMALLDNADLP